MKTSICRLLAAAVAAVMLLGLCACSQQTVTLEKIREKGSITVATSPDYPPFEFEDLTKTGDDRYVGLDMSLARYIASELGVTLKIEAMDFDATLTAITTTRADFGISGYNPNPERAKSVDFTDMYYVGEQCIIIRKADEALYKSIADFSGKSVAAQSGSTQEAIAKEQFASAKLELMVKVPDEVLSLQSKRVEGVIVDLPVARNYVNNNSDLMIADIKIPFEAEGFAAAVNKGNSELLAELNKIIKKAKDQGLIDQWAAEANDLSGDQAG